MTHYALSTYEKMQFGLTKLKVKAGLGLNRHDCRLIRNHYLATRKGALPTNGAAPGNGPDGAFRADLGDFKVYIRKGGSDIGVLYQVIIKNQYGPVIDLVKQKYPGRIDTILDAGANIGLATLHFKKNFPEARIVALEPDGGNYGLLVRNVEANKLTGITPVQAGVWKSRKHLQVVRDVGDGMEWSFTVKEAPGPVPGAVAGYGIMDLVQAHGWDAIDILKIDVEGTERYLFEDPAAARQFLSRTRFLAIEIHDQFASRPEICAQLADNGFAYFDSGELTIAVNKRLVK